MYYRLPALLSVLLLAMPADAQDAKTPSPAFETTRKWLASPKPVASLLPKKGDYPRTIPLEIDAGTMPRGEMVPLGVGIPLREGHVKDPQTLAIEGKRFGRVPAVVEVRDSWSDGSIRWAFSCTGYAFRCTIIAARTSAGPTPRCCCVSCWCRSL